MRSVIGAGACTAPSPHSPVTLPSLWVIHRILWREFMSIFALGFSCLPMSPILNTIHTIVPLSSPLQIFQTMIGFDVVKMPKNLTRKFWGEKRSGKQDSNFLFDCSVIIRNPHNRISTFVDVLLENVASHIATIGNHFTITSNAIPKSTRNFFRFKHIQIVPGWWSLFQL